MQIIDNVQVSLNSDGQTITPMSTNLSLQKIDIIIRGGMDVADDDNPYGLTIKPGPPFEVPPKTPAVPIPPNIKIDTITDEGVLYNSLSSKENKTTTQVYIYIVTISFIVNNNMHYELEESVFVPP
jgi:hypothetical protein